MRRVNTFQTENKHPPTHSFIHSTSLYWSATRVRHCFRPSEYKNLQNVTSLLSRTGSRVREGRLLEGAKGPYSQGTSPALARF